MTIAWVVGRRGLLGSALERQLRRAGANLFVPSVRLRWEQPDDVVVDVSAEAARFAASASRADRWEIYWAAGRGTMSASEASFASEHAALAALIDAVRRSPLASLPGAFCLASTAGAIYAGSSDAVISEVSEERPTTAYANAKLWQERIVADALRASAAGVLVARLSTLYGVGSASTKQQGLLTHVARCIVRNQPIRIFVPLDTIRDYLAADDAADMIVRTLRGLEGSQAMTKIVASERPTTIGEIVSVFKRLARRPVRISTSGSPGSSLYLRRMQFRSVVAPIVPAQPTSLIVGIAQVLAAERLLYRSGERRVAPWG